MKPNKVLAILIALVLPVWALADAMNDIGTTREPHAMTPGDVWFIFGFMLLAVLLGIISCLMWNDDDLFGGEGSEK